MFSMHHFKIPASNNNLEAFKLIQINSNHLIPIRIASSNNGHNDKGIEGLNDELYLKPHKGCLIKLSKKVKLHLVIRFKTHFKEL